ncbi:unnamed protein product [Adineta ricciae]|uniref:Fucosyltransferase n=1 Tax=Adineta ricciae TaxID=249248 RepID=A0A815KWM7_ADIRI|nr:unnamed protein product [Adineta ricciae]CAF1395337.1 unnamed protein product [Adineta ricciae]
MLSKINRVSWCEIPKELNLLAQSLCRLYNIRRCSHLPCQLIYSSAGSFEDMKCLNGGRILQNQHSSAGIKHDFLCKSGYALDLFVKTSNDLSNPSIIADSYAPIVNDLYVDVLNNQYRSSNSMWGLIFNFESISNYPTAADREKLKFFNVTFGYDRSIYEFVPGPWLFDYVDQIIDTSKRLSLKQVMTNKKPINSPSNTDDYWINQQTNSIQSSYVKASILWMNSNCNAKSGRTQYVQQMMKYIDVDNFGTCGKNIRPLPSHIVKLQHSENRNLQDRGTYDWKAGKLALTSDYLFTIAIENSLNYDYVTEKLWHAFVAGSVPIYLGAPNIEDWLPCRTDCIIDLRKFKTPKDAALFIKNVAKNRTLYESYHQWRNEPVADKFEKMLNYFSSMRNYSLECILCDMSRQVDQGKSAEQTKKKIIETVGRF